MTFEEEIEEEREDFVKDLEKQARHIYKNSQLSKKDQDHLNKIINHVREVPFRKEIEMEDAVSEANAYLQMYSTKAMYLNLVELNKITANEPDVPEDYKLKMKVMESGLAEIVRAIDSRDFALYQKGLKKIGDMTIEFEKIKEEMDELTKNN